MMIEGECIVFEFATPTRKGRLHAYRHGCQVSWETHMFTRNRKVYPNQFTVLKLNCLAISEALRKRSKPLPHWRLALIITLTFIHTREE